MHNDHPSPALPTVDNRPFGSPRMIALFCTLWCILLTVMLCGGPALGDHEVIVAQSARQILQSGEWIVLRYLDTPFLVKPPLAPWIVAIVSNVLPRDAALHLPVTNFAARLPSALATGLTAAIIAAVGRSMFGRRAGLISGFVYATSVGAILYALNSTSEALLTLFCTWAFAEFWWAHEAGNPRIRAWHLARFYFALGMAMLAKGPMPIVVVAAPLVAWWFLHQPGQIVAVGGPGAVGRAARRFSRSLWPQSRKAFRQLGLWWGIPLFLLPFAPWMAAVARRVPYFFELLRYEYLDRLEGLYPGTKSSGAYYYIPIIFGLLLPWTLSIPEALAAPFLRRFRSIHRPLSFCWYWLVIGVLALSLMTFKKPYYILPALPGLALLLGPVLDKLFFSGQFNIRRARFFIAMAITIFASGGVAAWFVGRAMYPEEWNRTVALVSLLGGALAATGFAWAGRNFLRGRGARSLAQVGLTNLAVFTLSWCWLGPAAANIEVPMELLAGFERGKIPDDAEVYWAGQRPDGRVQFYGGRHIRQAVDPYRLVADARKNVASRRDLRKLVGEEVCRLMGKASPVYCVMQREDFELFRQLLCDRAREIFAVDRSIAGRDPKAWVVCGNDQAARELERVLSTSSGESHALPDSLRNDH